MKIGFAAPVSGSWATRKNIERIARRAEEAGYHELWTFQRLLWTPDGSGGEQYRSVTDPIVTLAFLAGITSRVRLGVAVVNLPFQSPALLAKQAATLDIVSDGRLDLGLGLGWSEPEFVASGVSMAARGRRADEFVAALRTLWTDAVPEFHGEFYTVPKASADPKPVQRPHPPLLLGAAAGPALRRVGRLADGWVSSSRADLASIGDSVATIKAAAVEAGRDPAALRFVCRGVVTAAPAGAPERRLLTGSIDEIRADFDTLAAAGITELFVDPNFDPEVGSPDADPAEAMRRAEYLLDSLAP